MPKEKEVPYIFYHYIHYRLYEKYGKKEVNVKEVMHFLFEWRILKNLRPIIIKELEMIGLVKKVNRQRIKLLPSDLDLDDINKIYERVGLY